jgi:hypothetical protein
MRRRVGSERGRALLVLSGVVACVAAAGALVSVAASPGHRGTRVTTLERTVTTPGGTQRLAASATIAGASRPARGVPGASTAKPVPALVVAAPANLGSAWRAVALVHRQPAAWAVQRGGVTLVRFDQQLVHLDLHAGSSDGGAGGWIYGDEVTPREIHRLVAGFNGGFRLTYANVGFMSGGHVAASLKDGLASIVTYTDGVTNIGAWHQGVPAAGTPVFSVLQNQHLLVDRGEPAANVSECVVACWGETIGGRTVVARSGLGITDAGELVWAAGEELLPSTLARALIEGGAVRAVELDINPDWVAGYLYPHHPGGPRPDPLVPGQIGMSGGLLAPYSRDFLTVVANR